jgi:hypothetical protein
MLGWWLLRTERPRAASFTQLIVLLRDSFVAQAAMKASSGISDSLLILL